MSGPAVTFGGVGPTSVPWVSRRRVTSLLAALLVSAGCGRRAKPAADPGHAAAVLESVLAAWRDGGTCAELRERSPPVHVADEHWLGGAALESFTIGPGRAFGPGTRFEVILVGPAPLGTRRAVYTVTTWPAISVTLAD